MRLMGNEKRIEWIDRAKGLGIIFVLLSHCYMDHEFVFWIDSLHMALFFFLSGCTFSGKGNYAAFLLKKLRTLIVPYVFFAVTTMTVKGVLAVTHGDSYDIIEILKLYGIQCRYTPLWFITCLFLSEQCMYFIVKLKKHLNSNWWYIGLAVGFLGIFYLYKMTITIPLPWNLDLVPLACSFMCIGKFLSEFRLCRSPNKKWKISVMILSLLISVVCSYFNYKYNDVVSWYSDDYGNPFLFLIAALSGTVFIVEFSELCRLPVLPQIGKNSLLYFGIHKCVVEIIYVCYGKLDILPEAGSLVQLPLACAAVVITLAVLTPVNWFVLRYMPWCLGKRKTIKTSKA